MSEKNRKIVKLVNTVIGLFGTILMACLLIRFCMALTDAVGLPI